MSDVLYSMCCCRCLISSALIKQRIMNESFPLFSQFLYAFFSIVLCLCFHNKVIKPYPVMLKYTVSINVWLVLCFLWRENESHHSVLHFRPVLCCILRGTNIDILERAQQESLTVQDETPEWTMLLCTLLLLLWVWAGLKKKKKKDSHYELDPVLWDNASL